MIYLDNNATTRMAPTVIEAMADRISMHYGNPSSTHQAGYEPRKLVANARRSVADLLGARDPGEIVFTSCGSESDNWAILGALEAFPDKRHIVTTRVEHEAVRKLCEKLEGKGYALTWLDVDEKGTLDLDQLRNSLTRETAIVSVMMANNETGVLFPVAEIAEIVKANSDALFHVDGVNAAGKVPIDLKNTEIDLFSVSAHKFHGPKGIGALYIREGVDIPPLLIGGGQESGKRAGTEAVHQIVGLGEAAKFASDFSKMKFVRRLRDKLEEGIISSIPDTSLNGTAEETRRLPNTSNLSFENTNGEMILYRLDEAGICVSTGSACNSGSHTASPVLQAMNIPYSKAMGSIRFSLGRFNDEAEIDVVLGKLPEMIESLRAMAA
ncbi:MAG: aminotransferase class V-fold PLP-dependent enzyme [Pyrinomonadaceae bacterium]|nr:aminotransferase class V-fold PLP-dependent enzyme [Blastocatellia bacterium]MCW5957055.1 aminotransferase class V-fold PLP-dependent enzyme [Pyrinomonadaceae bacterium]